MSMSSDASYSMCPLAASHRKCENIRPSLPIRPRLVYALLLTAVIGFAGCKGGFPNSNPESLSTQLSVSPSSAIVAAGSSTSFIAVFTPVLPEGGSLTWSVNAPIAGTITSAGVYTASETPGNYTIIATWTPSNPAAGIKMTGSATVQVLPVPQVDAVLNTNLAQASGGTQVSGTVQGTAIVGQPVPFMTSSDPSSTVQVQNGLSIPVCGGSGPACP
jgi:hypothetical protein